MFIGPTAGAVSLTDVQACHITSASYSLRVEGAVGCTLALYTAEAPVLSNCAGVHLLPFNGAYPGIDAHFTAAGLDPTANAWEEG